ncbi:MAG: superoxide dismutase family protein [Planctomycetota bacterium]
MKLSIRCCFAFLLLASICIGTSCHVSFHKQGESHKKHGSQWKGAGQVVAVMQPTEGNKAGGTVVFTQTKDGVKVEANITGLSPDSEHAIHVHQFGDIRLGNGKGTGGHYNPEGHDHGLPATARRHAGDLGNLKADANGTASYTILAKNISVAGLNNPVVGRGVIIHAKVDDGGQPTGNAGARISQGVIGVAQPPAPAK